MDRMQAQLQRMGEINLQQQQTIRRYEELLESIGDEQVTMGVSPDLFRERYFPGYLSPDERKARDMAHAASAPTSNIPKAVQAGGN